MLNKELHATLTPTDEEGIFYVTFEKDPSSSYMGYEEAVKVGDFRSNSGRFIIKGTNSEVFEGKPTMLTTSSAQNRTFLRMRSVHTPNISDTTVFLHIKFPNGTIKSCSFYFGINFSGASPIEAQEWEPVVNQRIYLGPSEIPPNTFRNEATFFGGCK